ncbi:MAG: hypothetical protein IT580_24590 [Verrucomicrobiales bacterium]|nr:hypothetical protein [Verrucomicrobiales bacterium]
MQGETETHGGTPSRRRNSWTLRGWARKWWLLVALILAALMVWRVGSRGPRFAGHPASSWFPRLVWGDDAPDGEPDSARMEALEAGGAPVIPVLLEAAQPRDNAVLQWYAQYHRGIRPGLRRWLPRWRTDDQIQDEVSMLLRSALLAQEPARVAFLARFEQWPEPMQDLWFEQPDQMPDEDFYRRYEWPHLTPSTDLIATRWVGRALQFDLTPSEWEAVLQRAEACPDSIWEGSPAFTDVAVALARKGTNAAPAIPWMERWLNGTNRFLQGRSGLVLPALAPDRHAFLPRLRAGRGMMAFWEWRFVLDFWFVQATQKVLPWAEWGEELAVDLDLRVLDRAERTPRIAPLASETSLLAYFYTALATNLGPRAVQAMPRLMERALAERDWASAGLAADAIALQGHASLATLPDWVPAMTNRRAAVPLVLLLASLGPAAREARPTLERVAAGEWPWVESPPGEAKLSLPAELIRRYGLAGRTTVGGITDRPEPIVSPGVAARLRLSHVWPRNPAGGSPQSCTLRELAKEALSRLDAAPEVWRVLEAEAVLRNE